MIKWYPSITLNWGIMKILIVTPNGVLRNAQLREALPHAVIFTGYDGRHTNLQEHPKIDQDSNEIVIGRRLSSTQAGAVLSHNKAQSSAEGAWTCILEDDALVLDPVALNNALRRIENLQFDRPTIILLYSGYGGVYGKFRSVGDKFTLARVLSLPTGAVGYVINNSLIHLIRNQGKIAGGPDWPTWSSKVDHYQIYPPVIFHSPNFKSIYLEISQKTDSTNWPKHRQTTINALRALFDPKTVKAYGGKKSYFRIVILSGLFRKINH
jgi:hypothetical protein